MIIKKYTGGAWVAQSPKVTYTDIVADVTAQTPVSIFDGGKLLATYLPDFVFGGMRFADDLGTFSDSAFASKLDAAYLAYGQDSLDGMIGKYFIANSSQTIVPNSSTQAGSTGRYYQWDTAREFEEDGVDGSNIPVEHGDWVVITGVTKTANNPYTVTLSVVNNTYQIATSSATGVIKIGYSENGKNYPVELNGSSKAFVNVPWDDVSTANVRAAGALMDDELTSLSGVKTLTVPDSTTISTFGASLVDDTSAGAALTTLGVSAFAQTLLDDANAAGVLTTLGVDTDITTLSLPGNTTISGFGASLIDDADAAAARATLGVDAAGTDNSTNVTLAGSYDYITIDSNQVITRNQVDYATDISNKPTASDGLELDGDNFEMVHPLYVDTSDPTGTIKDDAIAFVG